MAPTEVYDDEEPRRRGRKPVLGPTQRKHEKTKRNKAQQRPSSEPPIILPIQGSELPPEEVPPQGGPRGGPFSAKQVPTAKSKASKRGKSLEAQSSVPNKRTTQKMAELLNVYHNMPAAAQAMFRSQIPLVSASGRPRKGRKKKGEGLEPILEHHDIKDDPYYMKPPLPTHVK